MPDKLLMERTVHRSVKSLQRVNNTQKEKVFDILQGTRNDSLVMVGKSDDEPPTKKKIVKEAKEELETGAFNFTNCSVVFNIDM